MDARFERGELRFGEQLISALLLHLAGAQLEVGGLKLEAEGLVGGGGEADHQRNDDGKRKRAANLNPIPALEMMPAS